MRLASTFRGAVLAAGLLLSPSTAQAAKSDSTAQSQSILADSFKPPQVFKNTNLVRNINIDKNYIRETVNVVVENTDKKPQDTYYVPFSADTIGNVGSFEAKERDAPAVPAFRTEVTEYDPHGETQYYRVTFPTPLAAGKQLTLSLSYNILDALVPKPPTIGQGDKQYLSYSFSAFSPSAYATSKQRTKLKVGTTDVPDFTTFPKTAGSENEADPVRSGNTLTYGAFADVPAGASQPVSVRFDATKPVNRVSTLERDVEVSHWGGNLAIEERYELRNDGAALSDNFDRIAWAASQYYNQGTAALRELVVPLAPGAQNAYFIDDVGNVSTSRFRAGPKESRLELRPRYPVFGGWHYKFKIGWDQDLSGALRRLASGDAHVLRVPFLEGPRNREGTQYARVTVRVILPEGATNVRYETAVPLLSAATSTHHTYLDTTGRTALTLTAANLADDAAGRDLLVAYDYAAASSLRKPLALVAGVFAVFVASYAVGCVDVRIGRKVVI